MAFLGRARRTAGKSLTFATNRARLKLFPPKVALHRLPVAPLAIQAKAVPPVPASASPTCRLRFNPRFRLELPVARLPCEFRFKSGFESLPIPKPVASDQMLVDAGVTLGEGKYQTLGDLAREYASLAEAYRLYVWSLLIVKGELLSCVDMNYVVYGD
jgi:hypothetical protein